MNNSIIIKTIRYCLNPIVRFALFGLLPWLLHAQDHKEPTMEGPHKWSTLGHMQIADNGQWTSYAILYEDRQDTLFVQHATRDLQYQFPGGYNGSFSPDTKWFAYVDREDKEVRYMDLKTGNEGALAKGSQFQFSYDGRYLFVYDPEEGSGLLRIHDLKYNKKRKIENVTEYQLDAQKKWLAHTTAINGDNTVTIISLIGTWSPVTVARNRTNPYLRLTWAEQGNHLVFLEAQESHKKTGGRHTLHFISQIEAHPQAYKFDPSTNPCFPRDHYIAASTRLIASKDGSRLFFDIQPKIHADTLALTTHKESISAVQVWHSRDKRTYPAREKAAWWAHSPRLSVWVPETDAFLQIANAGQPQAILTGDHKYALTFNPEDYTPQFIYGEDYIDIYLTDLATGNSKLLIEKQLYNAYKHTMVSPEGKFISYFKNQHWWAYDILKDKHSNLTEGLGLETYDVEYDRSGTPPPYGSPGWTGEDAQMIIYDKYDIWLVSPDGKTRSKLTNGRAERIKYRVYEWAEKERGPQHFFGFTGNQFDLGKGMVLELYGSITKKTGYAVWSKQNGPRQLAYKDMYLFNLKKSKGADAWIHLESKYDLPPRLVYTNRDATKIVMQGNPHYKESPSGRSGLVHYTAMNGKNLQGALFYPSNYKAGKTYPMIVYVYEQLSQNLHKYVEPSLDESNGFNRRNFTDDGYFVFYPDIVYTLNDPGISALECVTAAVNKVISKGMVDKDKIGLIGHSFGGYETSFIISQTNMFAAAVAGAPKTDLVSSYLGFIWNDRAPSFWRFEAQQSRFRGSYYQNKQAYLRNSPVHQAEGTKTPLLIWHGDKDGQVDWYQGIELYLALRRLEKECVFLVYPNEGHHLKMHPNKVDLNKRIRHWFDHYLKEDRPHIWVSPK